MRSVYWFDGSAETPTVRKVVEHAKLILDADLEGYAKRRLLGRAAGRRRFRSSEVRPCAGPSGRSAE
jgi:hypothetical protein